MKGFKRIKQFMKRTRRKDGRNINRSSYSAYNGKSVRFGSKGAAYDYIYKHNLDASPLPIYHERTGQIIGYDISE